VVKILLISDTHSFIEPKLQTYIDNCDEIWHAGDIGNSETLLELKKKRKVIAVYGNVDGSDLRMQLHKSILFERENIRILITHIAGGVGKYPEWLTEIIRKERPKLLICGHSHILKVEKDNKFDLLYINPGACGVHGFHHVKTAIQMTLENGKILEMSAIELGKRSNLA